jgi:hypothetical protein
MPHDDAETRLEAIVTNAEWLQENGLDSTESAKRIGLIEGDVQALKMELGGSE